MTLRLSNRQNEVAIPLPQLRQQLKAALPLLPRPLPEAFTAVDLILVDLATMTQVHADFLNDPTPTDVITFPYATAGEILICPAIARAAAPRHRLSIAEEVLLYGLHGLLHLAGYDDIDPTAAKKMAHAQMKLLREVLALEQ